MVDNNIAYERLVEKALLSVVHDALKIAEENGLTSNHFYITFKTKHVGAVLSKRLQEAYPEEMTIVLQYEFSALEVTDTSFAVTLSFGDIPERICIPFLAISSFADPHAQFAMSFHVDLGKMLEPVKKNATKAPKKTTPSDPKKDNEDNVVSLTAWRKKK